MRKKQSISGFRLERATTPESAFRPAARMAAIFTFGCDRSRIHNSPSKATILKSKFRSRPGRRRLAPPPKSQLSMEKLKSASRQALPPANAYDCEVKASTFAAADEAIISFG